MRIVKIYQPRLPYNCKIETQPTTHKYSAQPVGGINLS